MMNHCTWLASSLLQSIYVHAQITHSLDLIGLTAYLLPHNPQQKLPHKTINNLTTDWNDGTLVAALVDAHAPGLCPEADTMDPQNALENASHAMKLAEDWLGIPQASHKMSLYGAFSYE